MALSNAVASVIGSGANLLGSIFGIGSQNSTNKTNMKIAQMNNEWSERMMQMQNRMNIDQWMRESAYNTQMWNKTNEYNSAKNQAARLKEAGLNPALVMSGGNAGTASAVSAPSGNSVGLPSPASPNIQPLDYRGIGDSISSAFQMNAQLERMTAETNWYNTQSDVAKAKSLKEVAEIAERTRSHRIQNDLDESTQSVLGAMRNEQYLNELQKRLNAGEQAKLIKQDTILRKLEIEAFPQRLAMDVAVMASQVNLNKHNAQSDVGKIIDTLKKKGYKLSNRQEKLIFEAVVGNIYNEQWRGVSPWQTVVSTSHEAGKAVDKFIDNVFE